ncbi:MAG: NFACT family protein [Methanomassiliicoccales archaeon]|nr:MAG: NFACT family protein [Methanomassiliicoccales archaeon]
MKKEMNAVDILAMSKEMQALVGGFVDKVFHWEGRNVLIRVNAPEGRRELLLRDGKWLYMPKERPETPDTPSNFAVHLRKMLSNARVVSVEQREFDRIIVMKVTTRTSTYDIIFEVFADGNLLVVEDRKIVNCLEQKTWKHRDVRIGAQYQFPPSRFNPLSSDLGTFLTAVKGSTADVVRTLATSANLGGQYAEEVCLRANIDKSRKARQLTDDEWAIIFKTMASMLESVKERQEPVIYYDGDVPVDVSPQRLSQHSSLEAEPYPSLSEAIDEYLYARPSDEEELRDEELERLKRQLEQQSDALIRLEAEALALSEVANLLYQHYPQVTKFLAYMKEKASSSSWEELRDAVSKLPFFISLEPQKDQVVIRIDGKNVRLNYKASLEENADILFNEGKELKEKLRGAEAAMAETERRIEERAKQCEEQRREAKKKVRPTKQFWFETYRWFVTVGGRLVIGGRDARSNEQIVKKHLGQNDRYAHADVHGAASVIIKDGSSADEEEMREVCIFALASSKAWTAGVGEGSAYWVLPDQVSKTPVAGEFVPKGGFIIRGKRNYFHHLPMRLAIGEVQYEGSRKIMTAPEATMKSMSSKYVVIEPGETDRGRISSQLSKAFEVPEEEISRILPPGNVRTVEAIGIQLEEK